MELGPAPVVIGVPILEAFEPLIEELSAALYSNPYSNPQRGVDAGLPGRDPAFDSRQTLLGLTLVLGAAQEPRPAGAVDVVVVGVELGGSSRYVVGEIG
jgi:hypothetical protein